MLFLNIYRWQLNIIVDNARLAFRQVLALITQSANALPAGAKSRTETVLQSKTTITASREGLCINFTSKLSIVLGRFQILLKDQTKLLCISWQQSMDARGSFLETQEISLKNIQISGYPLVPVSN